MHFVDRKYSDAPVLSDTLLLPAIAEGEILSGVCGFIPSYIATLIHDLAESPDVEPGEISLLLSIEDKGNLIDSLRSVYDSRSIDLQDFLKDARQLVEEGGLELTVQRVPARTQITESAVFTIEEPSGNVGFAFTDALRGDLNSPIQLFPKHGTEQELKAFSAAKGLIATAELLLFGGDGLSTLGTDGFSEEREETGGRRHGNAIGSSNPGSLDSYQEVRSKLQSDVTSARHVEHAPPVESDLLSKLASKVGFCWCGNEYDRAKGCPG